MTMIAGLMRYVFGFKPLRGFADIWPKKSPLTLSKTSPKRPTITSHNDDYVKYTVFNHLNDKHMSLKK